MRYGIIGDIHGNLEALETVLQELSQQHIDQYICLGDVVGYNANPHECLDAVRELNLAAFVKGNHDDYASSECDTAGFNPAAALAVKWTRMQLSDEERKMLAALPYSKKCLCRDFGVFEVVHGTMDCPSNWGYVFDRYSAQFCMEAMESQLCFVGHTHVPVCFWRDTLTNELGVSSYSEITLESNCRYLINVGSVGQPRDGDPRAAYVIFDSEERKVTLYRVEYDIEATQHKIRAAWLPERLAERLAYGR